MHFRNWDGKDLIGTYLFTIKIDGIQGKRVGNRLVSKNLKPLYNLPTVKTTDFEVCEIYTGSCGGTWSIISASRSPRRQILPQEIYPLFPNVDPRLNLGTYVNPTAAEIKGVFAVVVKAGHEGLVIRQINTENFIKVKTEYTEDVTVLKVVEGKGRLKGKMGKLVTPIGEVGTGFTDKERAAIWFRRNKFIGTVIEVKSMEKTKNGLFRNPRFIRLRLDKTV